MSTLLFVFTAALGATSSGFPAAGPAPQGTTRELVCRGAPDIDLRFDKDPSPLNDRYIRFSLRFLPGHQPVGAGFENLPPGSCSWNPNNFPNVPPEKGIVYFDAVRDFLGGGTLPDTSIKAAELYPDRTTIPRYLKDPSHYWKFYVDESTDLSVSNWAAKYYPRQAVIPDRVIVVDSGGPAGKSTDRAGTSTAGTGSLPNASPSLDAARAPLTFHRVVRSPTEYKIRFSARARANATVYYSRTPPVRVGGRVTLQSPVRLWVQTMLTQGFSAEYTTSAARNLPMSTKYYFQIRVPAAGRDPAEEYNGEFDTVTQTVVVRFSRIDILNDSDKASSGDLNFAFNLGPVSGTCATGDNCAELLGPVFWETGSGNPVSIPELRLDRAPSAIRVWVAGADDDIPYVATAGPRYGTTYSSGGGSNKSVDWNNARAQFNIGGLADNARLPFKLRSIDGAVLMYEVHGELQVIRR